MELVISGTPPQITSNFELLKAEIATRLEPYRIQVTEENLAEAKKLALELGKGAAQLNKIKAEKIKEFSAPIDAMKAQVMELVNMIEDGKEFIKKQVTGFEEMTKKTCKILMETTLDQAYLLRGIREEFRTGFQKIPDLVGISKVTAKGGLTSLAMSQISALVNIDYSTQLLVDARLARLEAESLKAGLKTPLQKAHVKSFLLSPESIYEAEFQNLIKIEVQRQDETIRLEQERIEREAKKQALIEFSKQQAIKEAEEKAALEKTEKEKKEAEEKTKKAQIDLEALQTTKTTPLTQTPQKEIIAPPASVSVEIPQSITPQKQKILVVVKFLIETYKISPEELSATKLYFQSAFHKLQLPPATITVIVEKGE